MDLSTTIIALVVLSLIILPIVYIANIGNYKKKKLYRALTELADSQSCKISEYDHWKDSCIGIDKEKRRLFHIVKNSNNLTKIEISLQEVQKCNLVGINMDTKNYNTRKSIDKIELCLSYQDAIKPETKIEYYNHSTDYNIVEQDIKLAEKWFKIVKSNIVN